MDESPSHIELRPIDVATDTEDALGMLVLSGGRLVAVLLRLDDPIHDSQRGWWHLEAGFGRIREQGLVFPNLTSAQAWLAVRLLSRKR